jgi:hypothetical protein
MNKITILQLCLLLCLVSCFKKSSNKPGSTSVQPQVGETAGGTAGGTEGGVDGGSEDGGSEGGSDDGGSEGGSEGGTEGGSDGGTDGGAEPYVSFYFGSSEDAHSGIDTTGFSSEADLSSANVVDFNQFKKGKYSKLGTMAANKFEFTVGAEKLSNKEPVENLANAFGTATYKFKVENPVSQNGKKGIESGIETNSGLFAPIKKITGIWKFAKPVSYWGASMIDVESSSKAPAKIRLFDCNSNLLEEIPVVYPDEENGNKQIHFVGVVSSEANICAVSVTVGDYSLLGGLTQGLFRGIAIDDFIFGE